MNGRGIAGFILGSIFLGGMAISNAATTIPDGFFDFDEQKTEIKITREDLSNGISGTSSIKPWSSSWFPIHDNHMIEGVVEDHAQHVDTFGSDYFFSPMKKYAMYSRRMFPDKARFTIGDIVQWEKDRHTFSGKREKDKPLLPFLDWQGHCDGLAAAAILTPEPVRKVMKGGIWFTPADIKALLIESHIKVEAKFFGNRLKAQREYREDPSSRERDKEDIKPDLFHKILVYYLKGLKFPIAMDFNADAKVHNHPVYAFKSTLVPRRDHAREYLVDTEITYAHYSDERTAGTHVKTKHYRYILVTDEKGVITGGRWAYYSRWDHPDFVWIPYRDSDVGHVDENATHKEQNPYIQRFFVRMIAAGSAAEEDAPPMELDPKVVKLFDWSELEQPRFDDADELK